MVLLFCSVLVHILVLYTESKGLRVDCAVFRFLICWLARRLPVVVIWLAPNVSMLSITFRKTKPMLTFPWFAPLHACWEWILKRVPTCHICEKRTTHFWTKFQANPNLIQANKSNQPNKMPRTIHKTIDQESHQKQTTHPGANCKKCLAQFWFDNTLGIQLFFFARDIVPFRVTCEDLLGKNIDHWKQSQ